MPWEPTGPSFGFGAGPGWLPQPQGFGSLSAASQRRDPTSVLSFFRRAIEVRAALNPRGRAFEWLPEGHGRVAFQRGTDWV